MFYSYKQCLEIYKHDYSLDKEVDEKRLYKVEKGIYSDTAVWTDLALTVFKYPEAVFTMESALYYQGLTDVKSEKYCLATNRNVYKIKNPAVKQFFYPEETLLLGALEKEVNGSKIKIYSKERLLIELIRHKKLVSFDYYKSVISNYRSRLFELDRTWFKDNVQKFPASKKIMDAILLEVY